MTHASSEILTARSLSDRLQAVVSQHADLSRSIGDTPEQAVLRMKEAAAEAVAMAKAKAGVVDPEEAQLLREQLVRWTVDAFFGTVH